VSETPSRQSWNASVIDEFRENKGKVGGPFENVPILLLHTRGAKTGAERVNPLACREDQKGDLVVFASKGGAPSHPDWYFNLVANAEVVVEFGTDTFDATAHVAVGDERAGLWEAQATEFPQFAQYQERARQREIPVVVLERAQSSE
jgi:deazaflavin-dependent oxidoreductase (nitroreductase family)